MGFVAVCTVLYDYQPQSDAELELKEGELLYILEKSSEDDWWKAKKKAADEDEDEPEGLIPNNYVEEAAPTHRAKALYDYARQTEEEVSFAEDATIEVYDTSDPDWTLVHVDGEYGFAPANYIELTKPMSAAAPKSPIAEQEPSPPASPVRELSGPAANLARVMGGVSHSPTASRAISSPPLPQRQPTPEASDEEPAPALPRRPPSQVISPVTAAPPALTYDAEPPGVLPSPPYNRASHSAESPINSPGGYHLYNVNEMVSAMGKRKKMPITLGINIATGTIMLSPEKSRDGPTQEWTAEKLEHYSIEGKHVFLELARPSKSLDLHAGAKDTAREIVAGLGEISGAHRAAGLKEVISAAASGGQKTGVVLYDFMAQGEDEVTVAEGDEVIVLDDTKSEEWWNVRRVKNGSEGVVPSSYIELTGTIAAEPASRSGINAGRSTVEQNRLEEERLAKEAARATRAQREAEDSRSRDLPERGSSLHEEDRRSSKRDKKSSKSDSKSRAKPDSAKVRTWTDHSGSFKVDAQFIGVADGKIHLHKVNGVKIAVPVSKMSQPDLDYVEKVTREPIEDHIPVADLIKMKRRSQAADSGRSGASVEPSRDSQQPKVPEYDWFEFFLSAGVGPHQCERYAQAMVRDSMDESVLPSITIETLRLLGLKEGDSLKVMKHLDQKYGRNRANGGGEGGLFSGEGGALKNNTSRQRPEASRSTSDVVDANALQPSANKPPTDATPTPLTQAPVPARDGFDDDAWTVRPSSRPTPSPQSSQAPAPAPAPAPKPVSDNLQALSLLDTPLVPTPAAPPRPSSQPQVQTQISPVAAAPTQQLPQQTGANPQFFQQVSQLQDPQQQLNVPRQRPQAPPQSFTGSALLPPPPRPLSAPQNAPQNQYSLQPLSHQMTGVPSTAQPAPAGQSLDELTASRMQQLAAMRSQPTGFQQGYGIQNSLQPQLTAFSPQQYGNVQQQPYLNGNVAGSPFADPRSLRPGPANFGQFQTATNPGAGGVNALLPPALTPNRTGYVPPQQPQQQNGFNQFQQQPQNAFQPQNLQPQQTGFPQQQLQPQQTGFPQSLQAQATGFGQSNGPFTGYVPPVPPLPQSTNPVPAPLVPQKTAAPDIKFGMSAAKLAPQPTGRRANLANASAANPFGF